MYYHLNFFTSLKSLIIYKIGIELFANKLEAFTHHKAFRKAIKQQMLMSNDNKELIIDYEFALMFKLNKSNCLKFISQRIRQISKLFCRIDFGLVDEQSA
jgi:hypothetical protein